MKITKYLTAAADEQLWRLGDPQKRHYGSTDLDLGSSILNLGAHKFRLIVLVLVLTRSVNSPQ